MLFRHGLLARSALDEDLSPHGLDDIFTRSLFLSDLSKAFFVALVPETSTPV